MAAYFGLFRLLVEGRNSQSERVDILVELCVIDGAIDHPISLGSIRIDIIGTENDFEGAGASDQLREPLKCAAARNDPKTDFRLPEDGFLSACKAKIARQDELVHNAARASPHFGNAH